MINRTTWDIHYAGRHKGSISKEPIESLCGVGNLFTIGTEVTRNDLGLTATVRRYRPK